MLKKIIIVVFFMSFFTFISPNVKAATFTNNQEVDKNKTWTIHFNQEVALDKVSKSEVVVTDSEGNRINATVSFGSDNKTVIVVAPEEGYKEGEKYKLVVGNDVHSVNGKKISEPVEVDFSIKSDDVNIGNTNANIANNGSACENGGSVYYSGAQNGLYKMKADGTGKVKLLDDSVSDINVIDGWIYYLSGNYSEKPNSKIYKVKVDGTSKTEVYGEDNITNLIVTGDSIYYKIFVSGSSALEYNDACDEICRIKTDGTDKRLLTKEDWINNISESNGYIYYNTRDGIYKIKNDGTDKTKLYDGGTRFMVANDKNIYFYSEVDDYSVNNIYKMDLSGGELQKIITFNSDATELFQPYFFNVDDDWIYYSSIGKSENGIYKVKIDGTQNTKINDDFCNRINLINNMLLCNKTTYGTEEMFNMEEYTINEDGSQKQVIDSSVADN